VLFIQIIDFYINFISPQRAARQIYNTVGLNKKRNTDVYNIKLYTR